MPCDNPYNHFCEALKPVHEIGGTPQWYYGMKVQIGVDAASGLIHSVQTT